MTSQMIMILVWKHHQISAVIGIVKFVASGVIHPVQNTAMQSKRLKNIANRKEMTTVIPILPQVMKHPRKLPRGPTTNPDLPSPNPGSRRKKLNN